MKFVVQERRSGWANFFFLSPEVFISVMQFANAFTFAYSMKDSNSFWKTFGKKYEKNMSNFVALKSFLLSRLISPSFLSWINFASNSAFSCIGSLHMRRINILTMNKSIYSGPKTPSIDVWFSSKLSNLLLFKVLRHGVSGWLGEFLSYISNDGWLPSSISSWYKSWIFLSGFGVVMSKDSCNL